MDVKEKLVEQLREVSDLTPPICGYQEPKEVELFGKNVTVYCKPFEQFQGLMREAADYIANGVTVQEWISVKDRLPENDAYINVTTDGVVIPAYWHNDRFYAFTAIGVATVGGVTHWMPLPSAPKGE